jgi:V8-like Glu-specific endopeptidase
MIRTLLFLIGLLSFAVPARADDISAAGRSVVRVVVIAFEDGEVVGFGHGSGFAVAPNRIVTNAHVVAPALDYPGDVVVGVVPSEGSKAYQARVVRADPSRDLVLLEIAEGSVPPVPLFIGPVPDGSAVAALGYPGNVDLATARSADDYITPLPPTRSMGNYSNERAINGIAALLHTANIARGNSGGPLLDLCGRVIGVNTFITRGDNGDSPFAFAIANRELATFLRSAGQPFRAVSNECVGLAERLQQDRDRTAEEERRRLAAEQARERERRERIEQARLQTEDIRQNRAFFALILLVLAFFAMGGALVMLHKDKARPAAILGALGSALLIGAAAMFFTRPRLGEIVATEPDGAAKGESAAGFAGDHLCRLVQDRSRVTVSTTDDVSLRWTETGCVNGRTQYAREGQSWTRILVPNGDQTVSVLEVRPGSRQYIVHRYLLPAEAMARARALRQRIPAGSCAAEEGDTRALAQGQAEIRRILPQLPNERLVYDCSDEKPPA